MNRPGHSSARWSILSVATLVGAVALVGVRPVAAANDPPTVTDGVAEFQGNQTDGVVNPAGVAAVDVNTLSGPIQPASGNPGVRVTNTSAHDVTVNSGTAASTFDILATNAPGIEAVSSGSSQGLPDTDSFLGIPVLGAPGGVGGVVHVTNWSDIDISATGAAGSPGITARASTAGYSPAVIIPLTFFQLKLAFADPADPPFKFSVVAGSLKNPDGTAATLATPIAGTLVDNEGRPITDDGGNPTTGGTFVINADGTASFTQGADFDDLAEGETARVALKYTVHGVNATGGTEDTQAALVAIVTRKDGNLVVGWGASFDKYGPNSVAGTALPDLKRYAANMLALAATGRAGNSVTVDNRGTITTDGTGGHGILGQSEGGTGARGYDGGLFSGPAGGGSQGARGGDVTVIANGEITTQGSKSAGAMALSFGGTGGGGGDGGFWRDGAAGGRGGFGGYALLQGAGDINTIGQDASGQDASGIVAISSGGDGGNGGSADSSAGGNGGYGGSGGLAEASGSWNIITGGASAYGIWAKSVGGDAGSGGSAGWLLGSGGMGGEGAVGGTAKVTSGGRIETHGADAHGIYAESIGGFGGQGGSQTGLFYSRGGSGQSAGSGGSVEVTQVATGEIFTYGANAHGIFAQSVGGGGGSGGGAGAIVGVGGTGAAGGNGGAATVTNFGKIHTYGTSARGIYAQSVGGGGGDGGSGAGVAGIGGAASQNVSASTGGAVTVTNAASGSIDTALEKSDAIFAQSVGGGGGSGGSSGGLASVGGKGKGGGAGGVVTVTNNGSLQTSGELARGIFAQSVGGGGGDGGTSGGAVSIGGSSTGGGAGGAVTVTNSGTIDTGGVDARGIHAQSIGGGGGNGGGSGGLFSVGGSGSVGSSGGDVTVTNTVTGAIGTTKIGADAIFAQSVGGGGGSGASSGGLVSLGGTGTGGGAGGVVTVTNDGGLDTVGDLARGILAQSVGGGGGSGGDSGGLGSIGGTGGTASIGKAVTATNTGKISTDGRSSTGIFAQSVGGGGGSGGTSGGLVSMGGGGAGGAAGGAVTVTNSGEIDTGGIDARGILAQSVGGGGGSGSGSGGLFSLGGSGAGGSDGMTVTVTNNAAGAITTTKLGSDAIFAQSVGGGGGSGASSGGLASLGGTGTGGGAGKAVTATNTGKISTDGRSSTGIFAQSVGGGGGTGGTSGGLVSMGGSGAGGGAGGSATVTNSGMIGTGGIDARGILAQSVGGGGGSGSGSGGLFSLGGSGSTASAGGTVTVTNQAAGTITTTRLGADAIFAQSVGGGGGSGASSGGLSSLGGSGKGGGAGGVVTVTNHGDLTTSGDLARGILAQSVGGGGGTGGDSGGLSSIGGSGGNVSNGGDVTVTNTGGIDTSGARSIGLLAQSIGGGGGDGGTSFGGVWSVGGNGGGAATDGSGGTAGVVKVTQGGSVTTRGSDANGIFAQAVGGRGGNGGGSYSGSAFGGFSVGGNGGLAGDGGEVTIELKPSLDPGSGDSVTSLISTSGDRSAGILAQSVGGGGGNGGAGIQGTVGTFAAVSTAIGGSGGKGGKGAKVELTGSGDVATTGAGATGVLVQSVGGGGGNGGLTVGAAAQGGIGGGSVAVTVGASGGDGGLGGTVKTDLTSNILTLGEASSGFIAQSVGGGGGNGGATIAASASAGAVGSGAVSVGVGGSGGNASAGGTVDVKLAGAVTTIGGQSDAVLVQSVGGGGGRGGLTVAGAASVGGGGSGAVSVGVGGSGGDGGSAGTVDATITADVTTAGDGSDGVTVQAVGGGGGSGGLTVSAAVSGGGIGSGSVSVGIGGSGGKGGDGNVVNAHYDGVLVTQGQNSAGLLAQSVGGGGGNGGGTIAAALSGAGVGSGSVSVALGGKGGIGGDGGNDDFDTAVTMTAGGAIETRGDNSNAVIAQSIGGGGGNGGYTISAAGSAAGVGSGAVAVGIGGGGAGGGAGKGVDATVTADIFTAGESSTGILAQSVGGGGGSGGFNVSGSASFAGVGSGAVSVGLGGDAALGGTAGHVELDSGGRVETQGAHSAGVIAQSIGGGGGTGGFNVSGSASGAGIGSGGVSVGLGGGGGKGGDAGTVHAKTSGVVHTTGAGSVGVLAQSVGGGGGSGGFNIAATGSGAGVGSGAISVGLGGNGGGGGVGRKVELEVTNDVITEGADATAVVAQSVGGGGGNGGFNVSAAASGAGTGSGAVTVGLGGSGEVGGAGGDVTATVGGAIRTAGDNSVGVLAQSVGGGGGSGGFNVTAGASGAGTGSGAVSVGLGGSGGGGGAAGTVDATSTGTILTTGDNAGAFVAQSIGGGGGNGGFNVAVAGSGAGTGSGAISVGLGGSAGAASDGGIVLANTAGDIRTEGAGSVGVLAQSVGGGGGNGGFSITVAASGGGEGSGAISVGLGGTGGKGGSAGEVTLDVVNDVTTIGNDSTAVIAQSVGGGGGNGGFNVSVAGSGAGTGSGAIGVGIGGSGGSGGSAQSVNSEVTGDIGTQGRNSIGVLVQSVGGGGGSGGTSVSAALSGAKSGSGALAVGVGGSGGEGGDGRSVESTVTGSAITLGDNANAVLVQSVGGGGGNGGTNVSAGISLSKEGGGALAVGVGGFGGKGGDAGAVTSTVAAGGETALFGTAGDNASALVAQSIGGGGGNGGTNVSVAVSLTGKSGAAVGVGVGGFGDGGGSASSVDLTVTGNVLTLGADSHGLLAQSVGGGGGAGGTNVTGALSINREGTGGAASIGVGGFGGTGGSAGDVHVTYSGEISVGTSSDAILAQSLGGGGGNGGVNVSAGLSYASGEKSDGHALVVGVGGFGGGGGDAGLVDVLVKPGSILSASGDDHATVFAQSVGGGGGNGAVNVSAGLSSDSPIIVGVGGFGGKAGAGGAVTVDATADIFASGRNAPGIFAQSLGGGGGNGGLNISGGISVSNDSNVPSITFGIGGFGGAAAVSDDVAVTQRGSITTAGDWSHGIQAQSLAGGGGNGALNVSASLDREKPQPSDDKSKFAVVVGLGGHGGAGADAGDAAVISSGAITTSGDYARGIFAQSVGGGGGTGGINVSGVAGRDESPVVIGVGGFGGGGGQAGAASVRRGTADEAAGTITTNGTGAPGIEATSIGGGGGDAGANFLLAIAADSSSGDGGQPKPRAHPAHTGVDPEVFTKFDKVLDELETRQRKDAKPPAKKKSYAVQIGIGGSAGTGEDGGASTVVNFGDITTRQGRSHGILAQSIGGGGGNASLNVAFAYTGKSEESKGLNFMLGGATGDGGNGASVSVMNGGAIDTSGAHSFGILGQSIGGGGGDAGMDITDTEGKGNTYDIKIGRMGGTGGTGGAVSVDTAGSVITRGDDSHAILAQSIGNGGGTSSSTAISGSLGSATDKPDDDIEFDIEIGIEGGVGGAAGAVGVNASGSIGTAGDRANAIFAQSVGGGGGEAGGAGGFETKSSTFAIVVGGTGGEGGTGGAVQVITQAAIVTLGEQAIGVLAQSVGGGGGKGGGIMAVGEQGDSGGFLLGVGGLGGTGSTGGNVTVDNSGIISTAGRESYGALAQSVGGGGGTGGTVIRDLLNTNAEKDTNVGFLLGGSGGDGALSGTVNATNTGVIETTGESAIGLFAQSVGGGGGSGSYVISNALSTKGGGNKINLTVGGEGGTAGAGGAVTVVNRDDGSGEYSGTIVTHGRAAHGLFAMSVGGGGGNGGTAITSNTAVRAGEKAPSNVFAVTFGGDGGKGGAGGAVTVTNSGWIETFGEAAHGIVAQSVGGGGGNGGISLAGNLVLGSKNDANTNLESALAVGGQGGSGNTSGDVTVGNAGTIVVHGNGSSGVFAQSVGGGGGNGGFAAALSSNLRTNPAANPAPYLMNIGVGGRGGSGADSGDVLVNHTGSILVEGDNAYGIFAQSVSGGGGTVGASLSSPVWMATDLIVDLALGFSGSSGKAGTVRVNTAGTIVTTGANSHASFVQQVNGGGGDLNVFMDVSEKASELAPGTDENAAAINAMALGARAKVKTTLCLGASAVMDAVSDSIEAIHTGDFASLGDVSWADAYQSIGGGGGNSRLEYVVNDEANVDLTLGLGGANSTNSGGGDISFQRQGRVLTAGTRSAGSTIQSIGGGGGSLDLAIGTVAAAALPAAALASPRDGGFGVEAAKAAAPGEPAASLALGATGGSGNNGGDARLEFTGVQATAGERSPALLVQSIGAGGGSVNVTGLRSLAVALGGDGGAAGNGGAISLVNSGAIQTTGALSHGVILQSIGGGGGAVFTDMAPESVALALRADNSGDGGDISFRQTGDIVVTGNRSIGVLAQSLGGGGGAVDRIFADTAGGAGRSGAVSLALDGSVDATGALGVGVFAQSAGRDGPGNITVTLPEGKEIRGGAGGAGVWLSGGTDNVFTNRGVVSTMDGLSGIAVRATTGNDDVENHGTVFGQIELGSGSDRFVNHAGAFLIAGPVQGLGDAGNQLINEGTILLGDPAAAKRVDLAGSFQQAATGYTRAELDFATGEIDGIFATGSVDVSGEVEIALLHVPVVPAGEFSIPLFAGTTGARFDAVTLTTPPSIVIGYALANPTGRAVALDYTVDFSPAGLSTNLTAFGDYLNRVQAAGSSPALADTVVTLVGISDLATYRAALSQLSPDFYGEHQAALVRATERFGSALLGHRSRAADAAGAKGRSLWMQEFVESGSHAASGDFKEVHYSSNRTLVGLEQASGDWAAGLALGIDHDKADGYADTWTSKGRTMRFGLALRRAFGESTLSAMIAYGWNKTDTNRRFVVNAPYEAGTTRHMEIASGVLRASHDFGWATRRKDTISLRPTLDLGFLRLSTKSAQETGAGPLGLALPANTESHAWVTPRLDFGYEHTYQSGISLRPYMRVGLQYYLGSSDTEVRAGFAGLPAGVDDLYVPVALGQGSRQVAAGIELVSRRGFSVELEYENISASRLSTDTGTIKATIPF